MYYNIIHSNLRGCNCSIVPVSMLAGGESALMSRIRGMPLTYVKYATLPQEGNIINYAIIEPLQCSQKV